MKAIVFHGIGDIRLDDVKEPKIKNRYDAIVRLILIAICALTPNIRGKSRMQQSCTCGSVRGASGQLASLPRPLDLR
jgi:hypothetical protein